MMTILYLVHNAQYIKGSPRVVQGFLGIPQAFQEVHATKIIFISVAKCY